MSIHYRVLGEPGRDNALFVEIDSGHKLDRVLFDCGEGCISTLSNAAIQSVDHLFFSHLHIDHAAGFDSFFRRTFNIASRPHHIWGPPETIRIMQNRFRGFLWNLHEEMKASWYVSEIHPRFIQTVRFELGEAYAIPHDEGTRPFERAVIEADRFLVEASIQDHQTPSIAYIVREKPHRNIDAAKLSEMGLPPGSWLNDVKNPEYSRASIAVEGKELPVEELRNRLLVELPGGSIAYLTDFRLDEEGTSALAERLLHVDTIVCECQYRHSDLALARRNYHMTTRQAAALAGRAEAGELILFHLSQRYAPAEWLEMLGEAREQFGRSFFAGHWNVSAGPR